MLANLALVVCLTGLSLPTATPPPGGIDMLGPTPVGRLGLQAAGNAGTGELVHVDGMPFETALRVRTARAGERRWDVQATLPVEQAIAEGDVCLFSLWLRGGRTDGVAGTARASLRVGRNEEPWDSLMAVEAAATPEWERVDIGFRADRTLPAGKCRVAIHLGHQAQTVELGGLALLNYGDRVDPSDLPRMSYSGHSPDAAWREAATARIERFRKADLTVRVTDPAGSPKPDVEVALRMKRHAFGFGSAINARMMSIAEEEIPEVGLRRSFEEVLRYREVVAENFNKVVFENDMKPFGWDAARAAANEHPVYRRRWTEQALDWLNERDIEVRGHYLCWAPVRGPFEELINDPAALRRAILQRVATVVPAMGGRVSEWDAVNHIIGWGTRFHDVTGSFRIYADIINTARELAPDAEMWVNEGQVLAGSSRRAAYRECVRELLALGGAPDGIGFMAHFKEGALTPVSELYAVMDSFAAVVPKLQLTEFDIDTHDEQLQADYLRDVMTIAFSHPAVEGIVMWGFWEGRHVRPHCALWRRDWSLKPSGEAWRRLVFEEWWTNETVRTGPDGRAAVRGFQGDYEAVAGGVTREVRLGLGGATVELQLGD